MVEKLTPPVSADDRNSFQNRACMRDSSRPLPRRKVIALSSFLSEAPRLRQDRRQWNGGLASAFCWPTAGDPARMISGNDPVFNRRGTVQYSSLPQLLFRRK